MANITAKQYSLLKRKYNQKEEENLNLREQIRDYECNKCNSSGLNQGLVTRLEMERDAAKGDCVRLREEINTLRNDLKRLGDCQHSEQLRLEQAQKDFDNCVAQFEVERRSLTAEIKQLTEELRQFKDKVRDLQSDAGEQRTRCNHLKLVNEQTERELRTMQDLLHQTETELASALDRVQELNDETKQLEWELKEARQERTCLKTNMARLDQEKDSLLIKVDEKTEQNVRMEAELESRSCRIANLEAFIADLQKKLDVALDTAARSEQSSRQHTQDSNRLRKELEKIERARDIAVKENSRLQDDLASVTADNQHLSRSLEASKREVEDLKLQLQQYVAEVRRVTQIQEEREAERVALLEQFRSLTAESASLENKHHSLESEAKSTKSCLREAQIRIQDLESCLEEKKSLVHGYESQLEEEVCQLRSEMDHLREQLGKERKNSATLENVLADSRQETLQRAKDNSELKAQVQCLQKKLTDLQDKLEHGSEALRRCQGECAEYQAQVSDLKREVTNQRFERARMEQAGRSRRLKRARTHPRSRSLQPDMSFSSSYICPCCFLNRISFLRQAPTIPGIVKSVSENQLGVNPGEEIKDLNSNHIYSDASTAITDFTLGSYKVSRNFSDNPEEFMFPERLINSNIHKSDSTFIIDAVLEDTSLFDLPGTEHVSRTEESTYKTETLASEIDLVLQEQRKFFKKFDLPISDDGRFKLNTNLMCSQGDFLPQVLTTAGKEKPRYKDSSTKKLKIDKTAKEKASYLASGDQDVVLQTNDTFSPETALNLGCKNEIKYKTKSNKPSLHFNEKPVKLPKNFELTFSTDIDADINKDTFADKNISVKMLFFPQNRLNCSSSSFDSHVDRSATTDSLVYVTAANSLADLVRSSEVSQALYTLADSSSNISLCKTTSESTNLLEIN